MQECTTCALVHGARHDGQPPLDSFDSIAAWHKQGSSTWQLGEAYVCDRLAAKRTERDYFWSRCLLRNRPAVIEDATLDWDISAHWVHSDGNPNLGKLREDFGHVEVQVADCNADEGAQRLSMSIAEYIDYWNAHKRGVAFWSKKKFQRFTAGEDGRLLYLKDWHPCATLGTEVVPYTTPEFFADDWLNEWFEMNGAEGWKSDYKFAYLGPAGSRTPLHADVLRSFSWSANLAGRKRWLLYPPEETERARMHEWLREQGRRGEVDDSQGYPVVVIQHAGEAIFVPAGWHHRVENIDDALSINHNWINATSLHWTLSLLEKDFHEAQEAIADCRELCSNEEEFQSLCYRNASIVSGLGFQEFAELVHHGAQKSLRAFQGSEGHWCEPGHARLLNFVSMERSVMIFRRLESRWHCSWPAISVNELESALASSKPRSNLGK